MQSNALQQASVITSFERTMSTRWQSPAAATCLPSAQQWNICLAPDFFLEQLCFMFHSSNIYKGALLGREGGGR